MKIHIIDSFSHHHFHEMFNASLLRICSYLSSDIRYYAERNSIICIKNILINENINDVKFNNIPVFGYNIKHLTIIRYLLSAFLNVLYLIKTPKNMLLVFNYNNAFSLRVINNLNNFFRKNILIFCHGELECLAPDYSEHSSFFEHLLEKTIKTFFIREQSINRNMYFMVLGDKIRLNLASILPKKIMGHIYSLDHSCIFSNHADKDDINKDKIIKLGVRGGVMVGWGLNELNFLKSMFSTEIDKGIIEFCIIGGYGNKMLTRKEVNENTHDADYVLFLNNAKNYTYKFTASGGVFDAINFEKPIIALRNDYFEYIFTKFGCFGYLMDTVEEMKAIIQNIINERVVKEYPFAAIKQALSPKTVSVSLENILREIKFI